MKKLHWNLILSLSLLVFLVACGPSKEEVARKEWLSIRDSVNHTVQADLGRLWETYVSNKDDSVKILSSDAFYRALIKQNELNIKVYFDNIGADLDFASASRKVDNGFISKQYHRIDSLTKINKQLLEKVKSKPSACIITFQTQQLACCSVPKSFRGRD